jgi:NADH:ubiquinone oxidoreductase subunit H
LIGNRQWQLWNIAKQPTGLPSIFLVCAFAETNRARVAECETELVSILLLLVDEAGRCFQVR